ncbi:hypothetical protein H310_04258 [Aphanomyces invadans]|uniref:Chromo domain-containing protein n=1 Tax=Aphanomyces invadans TaxID=157072 RepID=A0A024UGH3_9STRA|nr:hypothetical protein H310_04258 [Aphanomyces invadans]ETW05305.1 hypothetical protein H310_04258 [Aphanomyces invadans]|eukprot:XP_008866743.1 hypothetical protein H310_04258 [Aphanomyces invadans]
MNIRQAMTAAGRAQADGATERQNRTLEDALRCQVSYLGDDWFDHLATIEYAHQGLVQAQRDFRNFKLTPEEFCATQSLTQFCLKENLKAARAKQKEHYDRKRSQVTFKPKDYVMLATRNLTLKHAQQSSSNERPKLLPANISRIHDVFNVDRLKPYRSNDPKFAARPIPNATPIILDDETNEELFIVESLLKKRQFNRKPEFLVKWHGQLESEATWELAKNIKHVFHFPQLLQDLQRRSSPLRTPPNERTM